MEMKANNGRQHGIRNHTGRNGYGIKDKWEKGEIVLTPFGILLTFTAVALIGFFGVRAIENSRIQPMSSPLYSLTSIRQESEKEIRSDVFHKIIGSFTHAKQRDGGKQTEVKN